MKKQQTQRHGRKRTLKSRLCRWGLAALTCLFLTSAGLLTVTLLRSSAENADFERLAGQVASSTPLSTPHQPEAQDDKETAPVLLPQYAALYKQNTDLAGWIRIEGTKIDYPVMLTPWEPEFYLRRAFDKTPSQSGVPFLGEGCSEDGKNAILYGHNMENGTMFADLLSYAQEEFWQEHPIVRFDTLTAEGEYEVLAVFYAQAYTRQDETAFRYGEYTDLRESARFSEYLQQIQERALYDTGVEAKHSDSLLTLSTCSNHTEDGRFVVVAVKKAE